MRRTIRAPLRAPLIPALTTVLMAGACSARVEAPGSAASPSDLRSIPKIDVHAHYRTAHPELISTLDEWNMRAVLVNVTSDAEHERKSAEMRTLQAAHPDRFALITTFDPFRFNEPDFVARVIEQLRTDIAAGARGVKVWKNIGMEVRDAEGRPVQIDHPKFQPIWDFLVEQDVPVLAHIAEPRAAWRPLDPESPHYWYYSNHPQYHAYQHPERIPRWETIIEARDRWVARNPKLTIIGAHLGSLEEDVAEVAKRLDAFPNFHVETAARINNLAMQPGEKVRDFLIRYQDRVLWGTDLGESAVSRERLNAAFTQHWSYLAGSDSVTMGNPQSWHRRVPGLALPREVLEKIGHRNAERLLKLPGPGSVR